MISFKKYNIKLLRLLYLQIFAVIFFLDFLSAPKFVLEENIPQLGFAFDPISFLIQVAIMVALSYALAPKPKPSKGRKPISLEQFDIPTAEEGRPIQVLFGKKYIAAPNVVWYGHLKSQEVMG